MTPDEIRAEAIERLARSLYGMQVTRMVPPPWENQPDNIRRPYLRRASMLVDALGDMLPTGQDWFTRMPGGVLWPSPGHSEAAARTWSKTQGAPLLRQWTHEPVEVTE